MAYTEKYVSDASAGGGDGSTTALSGGTAAWTWAEMLTNLAAGQRANVFGNCSSSGNDTFTGGAGTAASPMAIRGVQSNGTPFDDGMARTGGSGALSTTFPVYSNTATTGVSLVYPKFTEIEYLDIQGATTSYILDGTGSDYSIFNSCKISTSNSSGELFRSESDHVNVVNCDFVSRAANATSVSMRNGVIYACRFTVAELTNNQILNIDSSNCVHCQFIGMRVAVRMSGTASSVVNCSFRDIETVCVRADDTSCTHLVVDNVAWGDGTAGGQFFANDTTDVQAAKLINNAVGNFDTADSEKNDWEEVNRIALTSDPFTSSTDLALSDASGDGIDDGIFSNDLGAIQSAAASGGGLISPSGLNGGLSQ